MTASGEGHILLHLMSKKKKRKEKQAYVKEI